jgi:hypothetical protein
MNPYAQLDEAVDDAWQAFLSGDRSGKSPDRVAGMLHGSSRQLMPEYTAAGFSTATLSGPFVAELV